MSESTGRSLPGVTEEMEDTMTFPLVPFQRELETLRERVDRLWSDVSLPEFTWEIDMPVDVEEVDDAYKVTVSLPGVKSEDLTVDVTDSRLFIGAKTEEETEKKAEGYLLKERRSGSMRRMLTLPGPVKEPKIDAVLKDGVLTLTLPKSESEKRPITIRSN